MLNQFRENCQTIRSTHYSYFLIVSEHISSYMRIQPFPLVAAFPRGRYGRNCQRRAGATMGRKPHFTLPGHPQHVVQRGLDRQACFFKPADYRLYL